jgi:hypothetical protein
MLSFYSIVLLIAIIILIIALTIVGLTLKKKQNVKPFPDFKNTCPDFWTVDATDGLCKPSATTPINTPLPAKVHSYVNANVPVVTSGSTATDKKIDSIDPDDSKWASVCTKTKWAKNVGILWDGVTNNNDCS